MTERASAVSVIIPAHDEAARIGRLLALLVADDDRDVEIIVACNGCTDDTAGIARSVPGVVVVEIPDASKRLALDAADAVAHHPARAYVDADVAITRAGLLALVDALGDQVLAAVPARRLALERSAPGVRWYYDVWQSLPGVRNGAFGRGVIVMSGRGHERVQKLPKVMSDDLAISEAFTATERVLVPAVEVDIEAPRTLHDLVARRVRIATGNTQLDQLGMRSDAARTSARDLVQIARTSPTMTLKVGWFVGVAVVARARAARRVGAGDYTTWQRDESSRQD